jgi:hypothetical protein
MTTRSWIRKLFARSVAHPIRKRPHRARLAVQALEDRTVPSTFTVTNLLDDGSVGSLRWAVGQANTAGGDQTIDFDPTVFATPQIARVTSSSISVKARGGRMIRVARKEREAMVEHSIAETVCDRMKTSSARARRPAAWTMPGR